MAKKAAPSQKHRSILYAAIGNFTSKRMVRSDLEAGKTYPIKASISGTVFKTDVSEQISGNLNVGTPTTYSTNSAAKPAEVLAVLLPLIPKKRRVEMLQKLTKSYAIDGKLEYANSDLEEATVWLNSLKMLKPAKRAGAVSFTLDG